MQRNTNNYMATNISSKVASSRQTRNNSPRLTAMTFTTPVLAQTQSKNPSQKPQSNSALATKNQSINASFDFRDKTPTDSIPQLKLDEKPSYLDRM